MERGGGCNDWGYFYLLEGVECIVCLVIITYDYYCNKFGYICAASRAHFMVLDAKVMAMMFAKP